MNLIFLQICVGQQSMPGKVSSTTEACCHATQLDLLSLVVVFSRASMPAMPPTQQCYGHTLVLGMPHTPLHRKLYEGIIGGEEVNNSGEDFTQSIVWLWMVVDLVPWLGLRLTASSFEYLRLSSGWLDEGGTALPYMCTVLP